ncbi:RNA polymerase sigma-70 factor [Nonlabens marinus S1-08]|uniref:RNA polymerase sigma-70 factor n=1 Tax=Nonlabens marinus S1-08 TaxID=1454201 RepID=W8VU71_9FLAO|nr:RNA polymerase sigma factor [Nonlabens marinus]BAO54348.1 RNA polymerase sigma-70 factor [Nonlabens marinus S1-08]
MIQLYTNEKKLIEKAAQGDRKSQRRLYDKHAGKMLSVCRQYVSPLESAEEIMLNGFFKVFTKLESFQHEGSFEGWVRRIMIRECLNSLRKKDPFKWSAAIDEEKLEEEPVDDDDDVPLDTIQECIDQLPDGYKSVFVMYAIDGLKHREIAMMLDISENTSKSQFRKARLMLQEQLIDLKKKRYEA